METTDTRTRRTVGQPDIRIFQISDFLGVTVLYASGDDGVAGEILAPALQCVPATKLSFYRKQ